MQNQMRVVEGDITKLVVDVIVNAANHTLLGGGGVDGAIHQAAGPGLLEECRRLNGCPTGDARITNGYELFAKYVIHTVGPVWQGGAADEERLLSSCYRRSLEVAAENSLSTVAFPAISTGEYRFPVSLACSVAVRTVSDFINANHGITMILFSCFNIEIANAIRSELDQLG